MRSLSYPLGEIERLLRLWTCLLKMKYKLSFRRWWVGVIVEITEIEYCPMNDLDA